MLYFFQKDLDELEWRIRELTGKISQDGQDIGESCRQSAETWHDNAPYDEAKRSFEFYSSRLRDLQRIRKQVQLISPPTETDKIRAGHKVTALDLDNGEQITFKVGSYMVFDENEISYQSPLARLLIGASVDDIRAGRMGKKKKAFRVLAIDL